MLKDDIWPNPLQYYLSPEVNGVSDDSSSESNEELDDSVVVVGDDDDDDDGMLDSTRDFSTSLKSGPGAC